MRKTSIMMAVASASLAACGLTQQAHANEEKYQTSNGYDSTSLKFLVLPSVHANIAPPVLPPAQPVATPPPPPPPPSGHIDYPVGVGQGLFTPPNKAITSIKYLLVAGGGGGGSSYQGGASAKAGAGGAAGQTMRGSLPINSTYPAYYFVVGKAGYGSCGNYAQQMTGTISNYSACKSSGLLNGVKGGDSIIYNKQRTSIRAIARGGVGGGYASIPGANGSSGQAAKIGGYSGLYSIAGAGGIGSTYSVAETPTGGKNAQGNGAGGGGGGSWWLKTIKDHISAPGGSGSPGFVRICWGNDTSCS